MELLLNPFKKKINCHLNQYLEEFKKEGIIVKFDKKLEKDSFNLSFEIKNQLELNSKLEMFKKIKIDKLLEIFNGSVDV